MLSPEVVKDLALQAQRIYLNDREKVIVKDPLRAFHQLDYLKRQHALVDNSHKAGTISSSLEMVTEAPTTMSRRKVKADFK